VRRRKREEKRRNGREKESGFTANRADALG
jgi:hypothetical protein